MKEDLLEKLLFWRTRKTLTSFSAEEICWKKLMTQMEEATYACA